MAMSREMFKSILLISLIAMAVVLSRLVLLDDQPLTLDATKAVETSVVSVEKYISPQSYYVSFGGLSYTRVYETQAQQKIWDALRPVVSSSFLNYDTIETIDKETYVAAFSDKSILLRLGFALSASDWLTLFDGSLKLADEVGTLVPYELLIRGDSPQKLFVFDKDHNTYYVLNTTEAVDAVTALVDGIVSDGYIEYRKISDRFSLLSTIPEDPNRLNYELLPYQYTHLTQSLQVKNEVSLDSDKFDEEVAGLAAAVFGNRLDFVKRLQDINGSTVLMYGYGDKALTVAENGEITLNQKFNTSSAYEADLKQSLGVAVGALEQFGKLPTGLQLSKVSVTEEDYRKYTFFFTYKLEDTLVSAISGGLEVTVKGGQVTVIKKNIKDIVSRVYTNVDQMYSIDNSITLNYLDVSLYYLQDNDIYDATLSSIQYYFPIRGAIETIELQYYQENDTMVPVWKIVISGRTFIFNAYSGALIQNYR